MNGADRANGYEGERWKQPEKRKQPDGWVQTPMDANTFQTWKPGNGKPQPSQKPKNANKPF